LVERRDTHERSRDLSFILIASGYLLRDVSQRHVIVDQITWINRDAVLETSSTSIRINGIRPRGLGPARRSA
jgi:hypothetical protein